VKPANCALAVGLPTSREGFDKALQTETADLAKRFLGGWEQYYSQFAIDFEKIEPQFRNWGVTVVRDASLSDFADLFGRPFDVVILFSHWCADAVEFRGGLSGASAVAAAIPLPFSGILDLCVCHPDALARELRIHRPHCLVKHIPGEAAPRYWLYFYRTLFSQLRTRDLTYLPAIEDVAGAFLDSALAKGAKERS